MIFETYDHQRSLLTWEHPIIEVPKHISIKAYRKVNKFSSEYVDIGGYNYLSMWT